MYASLDPTESTEVSNRSVMAERFCHFIISGLLLLPVYLGARHGLMNLEQNPVLESALAGAFLIHLWTRPGRDEWIPVLGIGALASAAYVWLHHGFGPYLGAAPAVCAAFLGAGSLAVMATRAFAEQGPERKNLRSTFFAAAAFPYFSFILAIFLNLTAALHPKVWDLWLYVFDASLNFRAGSLVGQLFEICAPLRVAGIFIYQEMPLAICLLVALERATPERFNVSVLRLFLAVGFAGALLYNLFPAAGPLYVFGKDFPNHLPDASAMMIQPLLVPRAPRNAMPSVHLACALLIWWNTVGLARGLRVAAAVFLALTALATLGFGEHYLIDLIVAVPFALAVQASCMASVPRQSAARRASFVGGAALTLAWIAVLRFSLLPNSAWPAWAAILVTLALSIWWKYKLSRQAGPLTNAHSGVQSLDFLNDFLVLGRRRQNPPEML